MLDGVEYNSVSYARSYARREFAIEVEDTSHAKAGIFPPGSDMGWCDVPATQDADGKLSHLGGLAGTLGSSGSAGFGCGARVLEQVDSRDRIKGLLRGVLPGTSG